jgi:hypothetical protein
MKSTTKTGPFDRPPTALRKAALIRDCQPGPVALNFSSTSLSSRSDTSDLLDLVEPFGRPGMRRNGFRNAGGSTALPARAVAKSSAVHSGLSSSKTSK